MAYEQKSKFIEALGSLTDSSDLDYEVKFDFNQQVRAVQRLIEKPLKEGESKNARIERIKIQLEKLDDLKLPK